MKPVYFIWIFPALLVLALAVFLYGSADTPSSLTNAKALAAQHLPDLPPPFAIERNPDDDASLYYEQALTLFDSQRAALPKTREHDELVAGICELLESAARAGRVPVGFMDRHIPVSIGAVPDFDDALEEIFTLAVYESARRYTHDDPDGARDLAMAVFVFGRRLFDNNTRLYNRNTGLDMMESAGSLLYDMSANDTTIDAENMREWSRGLDQIRKHWQPKLQFILGTDPQIGDLVNVAQHDEDRMFRIVATLRLGVHKHSPVGRGNLRLIHHAIQEAMQSEDPMIAEAGRAADAMTLQERRRYY